MIWSQEDVIFPVHAVGEPGPLPKAAQPVSFDLAGRERLHGLHVPPLREEPGPRTLVLGFGGNAWNGADVASYLHKLFPAAHVVVFHYRGYRPSTGKPSARALLEDAPLVARFAAEQVQPDQTIAVGFSIGSAIAASLAGRFDADGLILVTPFDSLKAVAGEIYPWLPVGLLFQHELNAREYLDEAQVPVAIVAAEWDEIIPASRTDALRKAVPNLVYDRTIQGAGHNDIYARPEFEAAMKQAFAALKAD